MYSCKHMQMISHCYHPGFRSVSDRDQPPHQTVTREKYYKKKMRKQKKPTYRNQDTHTLFLASFRFSVYEDVGSQITGCWIMVSKVVYMSSKFHYYLFDFQRVSEQPTSDSWCNANLQHQFWSPLEQFGYNNVRSQTRSDRSGQRIFIELICVAKHSVVLPSTDICNSRETIVFTLCMYASQEHGYQE